MSERYFTVADQSTLGRNANPYGLTAEEKALIIAENERRGLLGLIQDRNSGMTRENARRKPKSRH